IRIEQARACCSKGFQELNGGVAILPARWRQPAGGSEGSERAMIDGLFRTYRPELHDMRGPGSKWHAKHGVRIGQTVFVDGGCRGAIAAPARRIIKLQDRRAKWKRASPMLQILTLVLAMLVNPATAARTETSYCGRYLAAARLRWAPTLTNPLI